MDFRLAPIPLAIGLLVSPSITASEEGFVLEEVIVTAQRKAERLIEAPVAVNLISNEKIADFAIFQADELGKLAAGLDVRVADSSNTGVGLRGVGTFEIEAAPSRVGTYMDDFYMASQAGFALGAMFDMSNVQVLRGPQGTLYGQPSPVGALILNTANPDLHEMTGYARGSITDPEGYNVQGAISIPVIEGTLGVRVAGLTDERETGTRNIVRGTDTEGGRDAFRIKALWEPTENFDAVISYHRSELKETLQDPILETLDRDAANFVLAAEDRKAINDYPTRHAELENDFWTAKLDWDVGSVNISWFSGWLKSVSRSEFDDDRTEQPIGYLTVATDVGEDIEDGMQHELRVSGTAFDRWDWVVGGYYGNAESEADVAVHTSVEESGGVFVTDLQTAIGSKTKAVFTHNTLGLTESLDLIVGVRYNEFESSVDNVITGDFWFGSSLLPGGGVSDAIVILPDVFPCPDGSAAPCYIANEGDDQEWTGTIKLAYQFDASTNMYATLDRGFRPGSANFDTDGIFQPEFNTYDGESVNAFELGVKGELFGQRARYTAAFFYNVYEDYQAKVELTAYNILTGEVETATNRPIVNVDEAEQIGIEGEFDMLLTDNWSVFLSLTYAEVEFSDGDVPCTDPSQGPLGPENRFHTCDAKGTKASPQPEWFGTLQSEYVFREAFSSLEPYVSGLIAYRGEGEVPGDVEGRSTTDSFTTLDLFAGVRGKDWDAQLFAKNVTDEEGELDVRSVGDAYNHLLLIPPRTYGISIGYHW